MSAPPTAPRGDASPWYRQPETFIAFAALIVSVSAVVVGVYEASLQRAHDRAEVWPHLELETFVEPKGASVYLENTGIGPGIVQSMVVTVDGHPERNWDEVVAALEGHPGTPYANTSAVDHALPAGQRIALLSIDRANLPSGFWPWIGRLGITVCYRSVFDERWQLASSHLGVRTSLRAVDRCPPQAPGTDL